jgi:hypothetical protein
VNTKYISTRLVYTLTLLMVLTACQPFSPLPAEPTESPTVGFVPTHTEQLVKLPTETPATFPSPIDTATASPTTEPTPTRGPSFDFVVKFRNRFDPDVFPAIDVLHNPPEIAQVDEAVQLKFDLVSGYCMEIGTCFPKPTLYVVYGAQGEFTRAPLTRDSEESWVANLPVADQKSNVLRYYLEAFDNGINLTVRYPVAGSINTLVVDALIPVEFAAQKPVETGELIFSLPWGGGPTSVGLTKREGYPMREGPNAITVDNGRIALLDHVNGRILIYNPSDQSFASLLLPFEYIEVGTMLQFDRDGQLAVLDPVGKLMESTTVHVPQLYRMTSDGSVEQAAPVYAHYPLQLTRDLWVLDGADSRLVVPFDNGGKVNSREVQRQKRDQALPFRYLEGQDPYLARFGDTLVGLAFEANSVSPLGAITQFERTPHGYLAVFHGEWIRAIWWDPAGKILKDITLPNDQFSEVYFLTQVAIDQEGSIYVLESTPKGIEVRFVKAP